MNNELIVKINPTEIFQAQNEGKDFIVNPNAENAIIRLLEIQSEVNDAVELLKSEIENTTDYLLVSQKLNVKRRSESM